MLFREICRPELVYRGKEGKIGRTGLAALVPRRCAVMEKLSVVYKSECRDCLAFV